MAILEFRIVIVHVSDSHQIFAKPCIYHNLNGED